MLIIKNGLHPILKNQTIGHQFPQIFDLEIRHFVFFFNVVKLTMATMAGNNKHFCAAGLDLVHFSSGVIDFLSLSNQTGGIGARLIICGDP